MKLTSTKKIKAKVIIIDDNSLTLLKNKDTIEIQLSEIEKIKRRKFSV